MSKINILLEGEDHQQAYKIIYKRPMCGKGRREKYEEMRKSFWNRMRKQYKEFWCSIPDYGEAILQTRYATCGIGSHTSHVFYLSWRVKDGN